MAVYTEVSDDQLFDFIADYDVGEPVSFKGIAEGVENTNYLVETTSGRFILTLYEKRVAEVDLPYFLGLIEHLAAKGISCPTPVRNKSGAHLGRLSGRPAALVTFLDGLWSRRPQPHHCAKVGAALAELHLAGLDYTGHRENALGQTNWRPLYHGFSTRVDEIRPGLSDIIHKELDYLQGSWPADRLPQGVIHADLFPDNVFFMGRELSGLIDFYFACNDALAYDLAICLNAWCFEPDRAFNLTKGIALLKGYQSVRRLEQAECDALPVLCRGAALRFLLTRSHDWLNHEASALVKPHDPKDYIARLLFHQSVSSSGEYGLERPA